MTNPDPVTLAQARAIIAKQRLGTTVGALQARLDPRTVARDAVDGLTETGEKAIRESVGAAKRHPGRVVGALAVAGALLARRRIVAMFGRKQRAPDGAAQPVDAARVR